MNDELKIISRRYWEYPNKSQKPLLNIINSDFAKLRDGLHTISDRYKNISGELNLSERRQFRRDIEKAESGRFYNNTFLEMYMLYLNRRHHIKRDDAFECLILSLYAFHYQNIYRQAQNTYVDIYAEKYKYLTGVKYTKPFPQTIYAEMLPSGVSPDEMMEREIKFRSEQISRIIKSQKINEDKKEPLNILSPVLQKELAKEKNSLLSENEGHFSGILDRIMTNIVGYAIIEAAKDTGAETYTFRAVIDDRTTSACRVLNSRIFKVSDMRLGYNVPPISFYLENGMPIPHPCRSWVVLNI